MASIVERIARLEADCRNLTTKVEGQGRTLYGVEGNGGLQADVRAVTVSHANFTKATASALGRLEKFLVGDDGTGGILADVAAIKRRDAFQRRLLWILGGAAGTELIALVVLGIKSLFPGTG